MSNIRMMYGDFRKLVTLLSEAAPLPHENAPAGESGVSLDAQVDKYLISYEQEAKSSKTEAHDFRRTLRRLLSEAGGDDADEPAPVGAEPPAKMSIDDIDVESFANSIVRLIDNYDSLLEVRSTLLRRATNFVAKAYDDDVVQELTRVLRDDHGMEAGKTHDETMADESQPPPGDRAGPEIAGGGGPA